MNSDSHSSVSLVIPWLNCQSSSLAFQGQSGYFTGISLPVNQSFTLCNRLVVKQLVNEGCVSQHPDGRLCNITTIKSRSLHSVAHLQLLTNVPTKYRHPTPYRLRDITWTNFFRSRSLRQGQRSNQGHTMTLHTYNSQSMSLQSINFLYLTVSEYSLDKLLQVKVTTARSNQGHTMKLHIYNSQPLSLPHINFLHLTVSEIEPGQTFSCGPPTHPSRHHE